MAGRKGCRTFIVHPNISEVEMCHRAGLGWIGKAFDQTRNEMVAIKARQALNIFPQCALTTFREITFMSNFAHPNVMSLHHVIGTRTDIYNMSKVYLQMELMHSNLYDHVLSLTGLLNVDTIRKWMFQILSGLHYIHSAAIVHRDIKPENILISQSLELLKITDFDCARFYGQTAPSNLTEEVTTSIYRSPEMTLNPKGYSYPTDMWGVGCTLYFVFAKVNLIDYSFNYGDVPAAIISVLGALTDDDMKDIEDEDVKRQMRDLGFQPKVNWKTKLPSYVPDSGVALLKELLEFCPLNRISLNDALHHNFLQNQVPPGWQPSLYVGKDFKDDSEITNNAKLLERIRDSITLDIPSGYERETTAQT